MPETDRKQQYDLMRTALIIGPARALDLLDRVPALFKRRGYRIDDDRVAVATAAVSCVKLGARGQMLRIPPEWSESREWRFAGDAGRAAAADVVEHLELGELLEPLAGARAARD